MSHIQYPRLKILQILDSLLSEVSANRFITSRPTATGASMQDFLLIRLPQTIYDRGDTYQSTTGQIVVFARDIQGSGENGVVVSGMENTLRLEQMQEQAMSLFPIKVKLFHAKRPRLLSGGTDGTGFHSIIIQFHITIFKS